VTYDSDDTDTEALQKKLTGAGFLVKKIDYPQAGMRLNGGKP